VNFTGAEQFPNTGYCFVFVLYFVKSEKQLLYDMLLEDLYDKIRRLEEDRHNVDITSGISKLLFFTLELIQLRYYSADVVEL